MRTCTFCVNMRMRRHICKCKVCIVVNFVPTKFTHDFFRFAKSAKVVPANSYGRSIPSQDTQPCMSVYL